MALRDAPAEGRVQSSAASAHLRVGVRFDPEGAAQFAVEVIPFRVVVVEGIVVIARVLKVMHSHRI